MKIKILYQKYNPLLKRKEVVFELDHREEGATIPRLGLRSNLAEMLKTKPGLVFVEKVETKTGTMTALGEANAYETPEQAKLVEREHIIARNTVPEKPAEAEKPEAKEVEEEKPVTGKKPEEPQKEE